MCGSDVASIMYICCYIFLCVSISKFMLRFIRVRIISLFVDASFGDNFGVAHNLITI